MNEILKFENVDKSFRNGVKALSNINLSIKEGEFISVIGPSGAGKSTFLRSINKLVDITNGDIYLDGESISKKNGKELKIIRRKIGMIFQNYNLVYRLSVIQNVLHGRLGYMNDVKGILGLYSESDKENAIKILQDMGMEKFAYNRASDLSGGQKQRVGIARAIMQNPQILLCDEPIASLDPSSAKVVMDMLYKMCQKLNIACIVNLHQVDVAKQYSSRIIGISSGQVVFDGKPSELTDDAIEKIYGTAKDNLMVRR